MKCDKCNVNDATITYTENINGKKATYNLCEECAKELGIGFSSMPTFDSSFFNNDLFDLKPYELINQLFANAYSNILSANQISKCSSCNTTFDDIAKSGKLGCANDYYTFDEQIEPLISQIQGANKHIGKKPNQISSKLGNVDIEQAKNLRKFKSTPDEKKEEQIRLKENLQRKLEKAIALEDYEEAARLRDEINKL